MTYRVWYIPQVPGKPFEVEAPDLLTARILLETLARFSDFELTHNIKPDYCDAGGVQALVDGHWEDVDDKAGAR